MHRWMQEIPDSGQITEQLKIADASKYTPIICSRVCMADSMAK